jgi:hypothetical protein
MALLSFRNTSEIRINFALKLKLSAPCAWCQRVSDYIAAQLRTLSAFAVLSFMDAYLANLLLATFIASPLHRRLGQDAETLMVMLRITWSLP